VIVCLDTMVLVWGVQHADNPEHYLEQFDDVDNRDQIASKLERTGSWLQELERQGPPQLNFVWSEDDDGS